MNKTVYEDFKFFLQDTSSIYIGTKYTFSEILDNDDISFKFRLVVERYIIPEVDPEDTLETHLYFLKPESFVNKIYDKLKAKVKINIIEKKRSLTGKVSEKYVTRMISVSQLSRMTVQEKQEKGVSIQELSMSKLALQAF